MITTVERDALNAECRRSNGWALACYFGLGLLLEPTWKSLVALVLVFIIDILSDHVGRCRRGMQL